MRAKVSASRAALLLLAAFSTMAVTASPVSAERFTAVQDSGPATSRSEGQALASSAASVAGVLVRGIRAADLSKLPGAANLQGTLDGLDERKVVAIGRQLADQLSLRTGDTITLVAPHATMPARGNPPIAVYTAAAVLEAGMSPSDSAVVFMPLTEASNLLGR